MSPSLICPVSAKGALSASQSIKMCDNENTDQSAHPRCLNMVFVFWEKIFMLTHIAKREENY